MIKKKKFVLNRYYLLKEGNGISTGVYFPSSYNKNYVIGKCIFAGKRSATIQVMDKSFKGHSATPSLTDTSTDKWYFVNENIVKELTLDEVMVEEL